MRLPFSRRSLVCQQAVELVTDYLEGSLSPSQRRRFEQHVESCPGCADYLEQMRASIRLTGRIDDDALTPAMRDDLAELYRRWRPEEP